MAVHYLAHTGDETFSTLQKDLFEDWVTTRLMLRRRDLDPDALDRFDEWVDAKGNSEVDLGAGFRLSKEKVPDPEHEPSPGAEEAQ